MRGKSRSAELSLRSVAPLPIGGRDRRCNRSTPSALPCCSARCWCWSASCRAWSRCASARRCCWCSCWSACWPANPGRAASCSTTCELAYTVGSVALGLILFDGGLRTRFQTFRNVLARPALLATVGVLITAALTAPAAVLALGMSWTEALLVGAVVASTDAAAVFFLLHAKGLRLRPRVNATLEVESGLNDPVAIFLTIVLVEYLLLGNRSWSDIAHAAGARDRARRPDRLFRRPRRGAGAQPARPAAGPARAVRRDRRGGDLRAARSSSTAPAFSPSISPAWWSATARPAPTTPWSRSSTPRPGWRRSACSCCSACWPGRAGCRRPCCRRSRSRSRWTSSPGRATTSPTSSRPGGRRTASRSRRRTSRTTTRSRPSCSRAAARRATTSSRTTRATGSCTGPGDPRAARRREDPEPARTSSRTSRAATRSSGCWPTGRASACRGRGAPSASPTTRPSSPPSRPRGTSCSSRSGRARSGCPTTPRARSRWRRTSWASTRPRCRRPTSSKIEDLLKQIIAQSRGIAPSFGDLSTQLVSGDVAITWQGWAAMNSFAAAAGKNTVKTVVPKEGAFSFCDAYALPKGADNADTTYSWMNEVLDPQINADAAVYLVGGVTVHGRARAARRRDARPLPVRGPRRPAGAGAVLRQPAARVRRVRDLRRVAGEVAGAEGRRLTAAGGPVGVAAPAEEAKAAGRPARRAAPADAAVGRRPAAGVRGAVRRLRGLQLPHARPVRRLHAVDRGRLPHGAGDGRQPHAGPQLAGHRPAVGDASPWPWRCRSPTGCATGRAAGGCWCCS